MRHAIVRCIVLAAVLVSAVPVPAHAAMGAGFWRWWDSLSGPGPFQGVAIETDWVCIGDNMFPEKPDRVTALDCWQVERDPHFSLGTDIGFLHGHNNLAERSVLATPVFGSAKFGNRFVDAALDVGFVHFSSGDAGVNVFAWGPRVTLRPFAIKSKKAGARALSLRWSATRIAGTLTAADFGGMNSAWTGGHEWLNPEFAITIDFSVLRPSVRSR